MVRDDFAILILSHGRPTSMKCISALRKVGYTGKYYIIIDNEDETAEQYYDLYGKDRVIMFDKSSHFSSNLFLDSSNSYCPSTSESLGSTFCFFFNF